MFSFFKKKDKKSEAIDIPEWAAFFTPEEYKAFLDGIDSYFKGMDVTYTLEDGVIPPFLKGARVETTPPWLTFAWG